MELRTHALANAEALRQYTRVFWRATARLAEVYQCSADFVADHADFDVSLVISTKVRILEPIPGSPLQ